MVLFSECPGSKRIKKPYPEEIKCSCGQTLEIWTDEASVTCNRCKKKVGRRMGSCCLDWCSMAKDCAGKAKYNRYLESKQTKKGDR